MSDAGYILDKDPGYKSKTEFDGSFLVPTAMPASDSDAWWNWQSGYSNSLSGDWYVLEYDLANGNQNYLISPNKYNLIKGQESVHFSFTSKMSGNLCGNGNLKFSFNTPEDVGEMYMRTVSGDTADGVEFFTYPAVSQGTHAIDIQDEIRWDIYITGNDFTVYANGVNIITFTGADAPSAGTLLMTLGWDDSSFGPDQSDLHIKDCLIDFNTNFRDGFNLLQSPQTIVSSGEADSSFPISNLYNSISNKPAVFQGENITITMQADNNVTTSRFEFNTLSILGHSITERSIIKLTYGNNLSAMSGTVYIPWRKDEIIWSSDTDLSYEYVVLEIVDPLNEGNIFIGELVLGKPIYFSECFFWKCTFNTEFNNITHLTDFMAKHTYHLNHIHSVENIDFSMIKDTTVRELYDLFEESDGSRYPVLFFWDTRFDDLGVIYGSLKDEFKNKLTFINVNEVTKLSITGLPYARALEDDV